MLCVLLWALIPIVSKLGQANMDNHQFLFWSSLVSLITFVIIIAFQRKGKILINLPKIDWLKAVSLGALGTYLYYILLYYGYAVGNGIEILVIQYCWPIFVVLLAIVLLKERLNIRKALSIVLGFCGVLLVLTKGEFGNFQMDNLLADLIVLIAAFVFGLFSVLSKKVKTDTLVLVGIYFLTATIISLISMVGLSEFKPPQTDSFFPILINGVFVNGISYLFWIKALKYGNASFIAPFVFLTPVISSVLLIIFFKENFEWVYAFGMGAVILGGLINRN
jgi:drug/metabolite transporter (DMT)-like permease